MNLEIGLFLGITTACVLLVWYLYRRSKNDTSEDTKHQSDDVDTVDGTDDYEDLLLTGLVLNEVFDDDDSSADTDSGGFDSMDDGGGFDSGDGGGFDGGGFE